jgi:hypothetical protein
MTGKRCKQTVVTSSSFNMNLYVDLSKHLFMALFLLEKAASAARMMLAM